MYNVLFICTGNSARSLMAEAILNREGIGKFRAWSAGSMPANGPHPYTLDLLTRLNHDTAQVRTKDWAEFATPEAPEMDFVFTVCDQAATEPCPVWPGHPVRTHWGLEDPAALPEDLWESGFRAAYDILDRRAGALLKHAIETLDPSELKATLDRIGKK